MKNNMTTPPSRESLRRRTRGMSALAIILALTCALLTGCGQLQSANPITDVHSLKGRRIGVGLAWGPDYILSERDDVNTVRYNSVGSAVTALCYRQVDAVAVEKPLAIDIVNSVPGLRYISEPVAMDTFGYILPLDSVDMEAEIDAFIKEFSRTPAYEDLVARINDPAGYTYQNVPLNGGERLLHVGAVADAYPFSYQNAATDAMEGSDVEFLCHFANAYGYEIVFESVTWESMEFGIQYGQYDVGCGGVSESFRPDLELSGTARMTDSFMPIDIVLVVIDETNNQESTAASGQ